MRTITTIGLLITASRLCAIEPGEFKGPEAYTKFWEAWWAEMGPKPVEIPETDEIDLREVTGENAIVFEVEPSDESPTGHRISIKANHSVLTTGEHPEEGAWKVEGKWEMHDGMLFLFFEDGAVPVVLYRKGKDYFQTDPFSKTLRKNLKTMAHNKAQK